MHTRTPAVVTSVALVLAVTVGVFASASFATQGLVNQHEALVVDDYARMPELRTRGAVKPFERKDMSGYALSFSATFTPSTDSEQKLEPSDGKVPDLVMQQSIVYPTTSEDQEYVGPMKLPFSSQTLALTVRMNGECFEPVGKGGGYRLDGFDPECTQADLALGDASFPVTDLFLDVDSRLQMVGQDGERWIWRSTAKFEDPGYAFPIVSLGQGGSMMVVIGDMAGINGIDRVSFGGR